MMVKLKTVLAAALLTWGVAPGLASAQTKAAAPRQVSAEQAIRSVVEPRLRDGVKIESITQTPFAGLDDVRTGGAIF